MRNHRQAKINVKVLIILAVVVVVLGLGAFLARDIRRSILSARDLAAGQAAFDKQDWNTARKCLAEYLGRNPDDIEMLKKYAEACLSCRPIKAENVKAAIAAYRQAMRTSPGDEEPYKQLAMLYVGLRKFSELAYIAERRLEHAPGDHKAPIWLGEALVALDKTDEASEGLLAFIKRLEQQDEKYAEYAQACALLSKIAAEGDSVPASTQPASAQLASTEALDWLNRAVEYDPKCVEALLYRARFYGTPLYRTSRVLLTKMVAFARKAQVEDDRTKRWREQREQELSDLERLAWLRRLEQIQTQVKVERELLETEVRRLEGEITDLKKKWADDLRGKLRKAWADTMAGATHEVQVRAWPAVFQDLLSASSENEQEEEVQSEKLVVVLQIVREIRLGELSVVTTSAPAPHSDEGRANTWVQAVRGILKAPPVSASEVGLRRQALEKAKADKKAASTKEAWAKDPRGFNKARQNALRDIDKAQSHLKQGTPVDLKRGFDLLDELFRRDRDDERRARRASWAAARKDLELADQLGTDNPRIRLVLSAEWMSHKQFDRARAELEAVDNLDEKVLREYFSDPNGWVVARFGQTAELTIRSGLATDDADVRKKLASEGAVLADDALAVLTEPRRRARILSQATRLYVLAGRVPDARRCLDEYVNALKTGVVKSRSGRGIGYLQAMVAASEDRPYRVIDVLEPEAVRDPSRPEMWRLLAEAYSRTDQTRRSVRALIRYLRINPRDPKMMLQLAKEYLKLRDWNRAFDTARMGEELDTADIVIQLIRIEASIYRAVERRRGINKQRLVALAEELVTLRAEHPDRVDIRILQAIIAVYDERLDDAEKELTQAIKECGEPLRAEMQLVRHYYRAKRMSDAIRVGREACKNHPEVAEPWMTLSGVYVANKQHTEALATLRDGMKASVGRWEKRAVTIRLGLQELVQGDRAAGISLLDGLAEKDKQEIRARSLLLATREVREDQAKSRKLVQEIHDAQGESGLLWRLYQAALWLSDENWRAKQSDITEALKRCIDSDPDWSAPVLQLVMMHRRLGNLGMVEEICRQALSHNPSATDVADQLVNLLEKQERFSDAQQILAKVEASPRVASAWDVRLALRSGDFTRAIDELKLRAANSDQDADSRVLLARLVYWQTRDAEQALKYLQEAEAITSGAMAITSARVMILKAENRGQEGLTLLDGQIKEAEQDKDISDERAKQARIFGAYAMRAAYLVSIGNTAAAEKDCLKLTTIPRREARGYEVLGRFYANVDKTDDAIEALKKGARAYPEDVSLRRNLMVALLRRKGQGDRKRAVEILSSLESKRPDDPDLMRIRAVEFLRQDTPESTRKAKKLLERVVHMEPTSISAHLALIGIVMQEGQYETVRDMAIRAMGTNPDNARLVLARALAERALNNIQMAAELARMALRLQPDSTKARDMFVGIALDAKDRKLLEEAKDIAAKAVEKKPTDEQLQFVQTRILAAMGDNENAIAKLEAYCATEQGKKSIVALLALADLYRAQSEMAKSSQRIDQAAKLQPNSPDVILARLIWLGKAGKFDEIRKRISVYLTEEKPNQRVILAVAGMLSSSEASADKKEALKLYERLAAATPDVLEVQLWLASIAYETGDAERARRICRSVLVKDPSNVRALNDLAWILAEKFLSYKEALKLADKGLGLAPGNLNLLDTRGMILSNLPGRLTDAKTDFEAVLKSVAAGSPRQAKALLQLGRVCVKLNNIDEAKKHFTKAAEIDRKHSVFSAEERSEIEKTIGS